MRSGQPSMASSPINFRRNRDVLDSYGPASQTNASPLRHSTNISADDKSGSECYSTGKAAPPSNGRRHLPYMQAPGPHPLSPQPSLRISSATFMMPPCCQPDGLCPAEAPPGIQSPNPCKPSVHLSPSFGVVLWYRARWVPQVQLDCGRGLTARRLSLGEK